MEAFDYNYQQIQIPYYLPIPQNPINGIKEKHIQQYNISPVYYPNIETQAYPLNTDELFLPSNIYENNQTVNINNPIENYNLVESETEDTELGGTDTSTEGFTDYKETQKFGHTVSTENAGNVYGFNSSAAVGSDTGDSTTTFGAATDTGDTKEIDGTRDIQTDYGKTEGKTRDLTRHGNIGTLTNVKMLTEDTAFWTENNFYEKIAADMAAILTIPIYE